MNNTNKTNSLYNNLDFNNIRKYIIHFLMGGFIIVVLLIVILLIGYYLTPNNYTLLNYENIINNLKFVKEKDFILKPNEKIKFSSELEPCCGNYFYNFDKETHLIIGNMIKSQNVIITEKVFLKIKYNSEFDIINNSDNELKLKVKIYTCQV
jgi:hypothetical protein